MRWRNIGWLLQRFASSRGPVASFTRECVQQCLVTLSSSVSIRKPTTAARGKIGRYHQPSWRPRRQTRVFPFFFSSSSSLRHQHSCLLCDLLCTVTCPSRAPSLLHLANYYTHGENKQFPYLIIHITFI